MKLRRYFGHLLLHGHWPRWVAVQVGSVWLGPPPHPPEVPLIETRCERCQ